MASLFGITSAKYQYAIDEYYRIKKEVCKPLTCNTSVRLISVFFYKTSICACLNVTCVRYKQIFSHLCLQVHMYSHLFMCLLLCPIACSILMVLLPCLSHNVSCRKRRRRRTTACPRRPSGISRNSGATMARPRSPQRTSQKERPLR